MIISRLWGWLAWLLTLKLDLLAIVEVQELAHLVKLEEVIVLALPQLLRVLVILVARIQTLLLRFKFDPVV